MFLPLFDQPCFFSVASKKASVYELIIIGCVEIKCFCYNIVLIMVSNNSVARDSTVLRITIVIKFGALHRAKSGWIRVLIL